MIRRVFILVLIPVFCLFLPSCKGKETSVGTTETKTKGAPGKQQVGTPQNVASERPSNSPGSGVEMASVPASLFKIPDKRIMTENYNKMRDRMLGDLESELKWQEKLEILSNSASGSNKK